MTTRFTAHQKQYARFGVSPLETGFKSQSFPDDVVVPSNNVEDVDRAIFKLFDNEIPINVRTSRGIKRVPVIFAGGEKWAVLRKSTPRDKSGTLIIPSLVINRTNVSQTPDDITGRGINQSTGVLTVKRRLDASNHQHQSLINRVLLKNQSNVVLNVNDGNLIDGQISTNGDVGDLSSDQDIVDGAYLLSDRTNDAWETIVIPQPQFFTANYDVIIWTQYQEQMNDALQGIMSSFLPQAQAWRIETSKGYWFNAIVDGNTFTPQNNFDNMANEERMIKYQFTINVPAYLLVSDVPGAPVAVRRYISRPGSVSFAISSDDESEQIIGSASDPFLGADDPTLPLANGQVKRRDQRNTDDTLLYTTGEHDPANANALIKRKRTVDTYRTITGIDGHGNEVKKVVKVKNVNRFTGERVYSSNFDLDGISITSVDD